jgi:hypothetical protein
VSAAAAAATVLLALVLGRAQQVQFAEQHYLRTNLFLQEGGPVKAFDWARPLRDERIGIVGSGEIFFSQYGLYGVDLSNRVDFIGVPGDRGTYRLATSCPQLRRRINAGGYDYVVISQYTQDAPDAEYRYPIRAWTKTDPALEEILAEEEVTPQPDWVYRVKGQLDESCSDVGSA